MKAPITANLEDYLETIYFILQENHQAHASIIAQRMKVTRASVTGALHALAERDLVIYQPYQPVSLTAAGLKAAQECAQRHHFLHHFFRDILGMADGEAEDVACRVEHVAGATAMSRLAEFTRFFNQCDEIQLKWSATGTLHCKASKASNPCQNCQTNALNR